MNLDMENMEDFTNNLCMFLRIERQMLSSVTLQDRARELVVAKLCDVLNIKCSCNYKSDYFYFYSMLVGEAVVRRMGYRVEVANMAMRMFRYNGVNLLNEVDRLMVSLPLDVGIKKSFIYLDRFASQVDNLKLRKYEVV